MVVELGQNTLEERVESDCQLTESTHQIDLKNRGIPKFILILLNRVLAANCLKLSNQQKFCNGRKVVA